MLEVAVRKITRVYVVWVMCDAWKSKHKHHTQCNRIPVQKEIQSREMPNPRTRHGKRRTQSNGQKVWKKLTAWRMHCGLR